MKPVVFEEDLRLLVGRELGLVHELNHDELADHGFQSWLRLLSEPEE